MANNPMASPEHVSSLSDSEQTPYQLIINPSAGLTNPGPQPGLITEPQVPPSSSSDEEIDMPDDSDVVTSKRFFSEEDELALLNGMIRFAEENKTTPLADLRAFRSFVKPNLSVAPTTEQLKSKILKFKLKYNRNLMKEASGGGRRLTVHEQRAYELSKIVWANKYIRDAKVPRRSKGAGKKRDNAEKDVAAGGGSSTVSQDEVSLNRAEISRIGAEIFERGRGVEGEAEWFELKKAEVEVHLKKMELMHHTASLILDAMNSENR